MAKSPTEEIREIRHQLAARFDNDIDRIFEDILRQQTESGLKFTTLPRRVPDNGLATPAIEDSQHDPSQSLPTGSPDR